MTASLRRIWIQLTNDRRRFGVLCATLGVGLLLWARLIIVSHVPRTAMAESAQALPGAAPTAAVGESGKPVSGKTAADKPSGKDASKSATKARQTVDVRLFSRCERDPFVISRAYFPRAVALPEVKQEPGKLPTDAVEDAAQQDARQVARLRELMGSLKLEAAMENSMAVIGGKPYRVGDRLPAVGNERVEFSLVEVRQRSVVLEFQGRRFELDMTSPRTPGG